MQLKGIWSQRPAYSKLTIITGIAIASFSILSLVSMILMKVIFNLDVISNPQILSDLSNPTTIDALKFLQLFNALGLFVVPPFIYAFVAGNDSGNTLRLKSKPQIMQLLFAGLSMIVAMPLINWMAQLNSELHLPKAFAGIESWMKQSEESAAKITTLFLEVNSLSGLLYNLFLIALLPAFGEELLFRGALQPLLKEQTKNKVVGIILAAILFSALHMQFYGFFPRMMMGVYFGFLVMWTQNLWVPVFAHFVNNGTAVLVSYFYGNSTGLDNIGSDGNSIIYLLASILGLSGIIWWFSRNKV